MLEYFEGCAGSDSTYDSSCQTILSNTRFHSLVFRFFKSNTEHGSIRNRLIIQSDKCSNGQKLIKLISGYSKRSNDETDQIAQTYRAADE